MDRLSRIIRFYRLTEVDEDGCIIWTGGQTGLGYGVSRYEGHSRVAHRVAWALHYGELPPSDMDVDHLCHKKLCVNLNHLEVVTRTVNNQRRRRGWTSRPDPEFCMQGLHPWVPENWYRNGSYVICAPCSRARARERYAKKKGVSP